MELASRSERTRRRPAPPLTDPRLRSLAGGDPDVPTATVRPRAGRPRSPLSLTGGAAGRLPHRRLDRGASRSATSASCAGDAVGSRVECREIGRISSWWRRICHAISAMALHIAMPAYITLVLSLPGWVAGAVFTLNTVMVELGQGLAVNAMTGSVRTNVVVLGTLRKSRRTRSPPQLLLLLAVVFGLPPTTASSSLPGSRRPAIRASRTEKSSP